MLKKNAPVATVSFMVGVSCTFGAMNYLNSKQISILNEQIALLKLQNNANHIIVADTADNSSKIQKNNMENQNGIIIQQ
jgi:hypothetical protein